VLKLLFYGTRSPFHTIDTSKPRQPFVTPM
jgi:hypothetical protein